jgi:hypothetical protein
MHWSVSIPPVLYFALLAFLTVDSFAGEDTANQGIAPAIRKTAALRGYAFEIEEKPGQGRGGSVQGKFEKGQPVFFVADKIEFFRQGNVLVYKDAGQWQRSRTGTVSDPLRILGGAARVRSAKVPHEELIEVGKLLKAVKKSPQEAGGSSIQWLYTANLDGQVAKKLVPSNFRSVAQGGQANVWVGADGLVHKYALTLQLRGRLGNADIDGQMDRQVRLADRGTARVEVPEGAKKALE